MLPKHTICLRKLNMSINVLFWCIPAFFALTL
ncbi:hypothetical protein E2C01_034734 [Portunus trituberculatus]|uniref:Uncharacterized protein n=1 Tax=Portunus trituberculatus TaxID=210409 RepID=A0A5B7F7E3_PORTR|nr:hypothetical protein [Portunus trituberculatus]